MVGGNLRTQHTLTCASHHPWTALPHRAAPRRHPLVSSAATWPNPEGTEGTDEQHHHQQHQGQTAQSSLPHLQQQQQNRRLQQEQQQQQQQFQQTLDELLPLPYMELQQLFEEQPDHQGLSASFLFWLSAQEKQAAGGHKQHLAQLAAQLVQLKEQAEYEASRRMLPPLASSLAYSNYTQWRSSHSDKDLPEVTPGVSLTDFYKAAEREEAKLRQWQSPQRPSSTLDNFAAASGYGSFAADAMARVRARLAGFEDDATLQRLQQQQQGDAPEAGAEQQQQQQQAVNPAAERVLDELLMACCCREERATLLPEACMPPGLEVSATGSSTLLTGQAGSGSAMARVLTNPQRMLAAVAARLQALEGQGEQHEVLPSGESLAQALHELQEDVEEYDEHVYSRMSHRDRHGL